MDMASRREVEVEASVLRRSEELAVRDHCRLGVAVLRKCMNPGNMILWVMFPVLRMYVADYNRC